MDYETEHEQQQQHTEVMGDAAPAEVAVEVATTPELTAQPVAMAAPVLDTIEHHAAVLKTPAWLLNAARQLKRWPAGFELTEADYKAALDEVQKEKL